jgi:ArsR family transcriptional regulator, arsenate/arsenite/antimonite-responsive transcriptional repressor
MNVPLPALESPRVLGQGCCTDVSVQLDDERAERLVATAKALGDPVRLQIVDVLRRQAGEVCVCDLQALFGISQPTLSHHLKKLRDAGIADVVRRGQWAYYYVDPDALEDLRTWLS